MKHYQERAFIERYPLSTKKPIKKMLSYLGYWIFFVPILWVILIAFFGERVLESDWLFSTVVGIVALLVGCYVYANQYYKLL